MPKCWSFSVSSARAARIRYEEMAGRVRERFGIAVNPRSIERHLGRGQKKTN